jgi:hypothetical protein
MPLWFRIVRLWLPIAVATTAVCGLVYLGVQQNYRMSLNDPQVQLAQDAAARLDSGASPGGVVGNSKIDADKSLAPFVIVFGTDNAVLASSARLDGTTPKLPSGVLDAARAKGRNAVTWQPRPGVRIASASSATKDGRVVVAGRNMREVEARIDALTKIVAAAWLAALLGVLATVVFVELAADRWRHTQRHRTNHGHG